MAEDGNVSRAGVREEEGVVTPLSSLLTQGHQQGGWGKEDERGRGEKAFIHRPHPITMSTRVAGGYILVNSGAGEKGGMEEPVRAVRGDKFRRTPLRSPLSL